MPNFRKMSDAQLTEYQCKDEDEAEARSKEQSFRDWCKEHGIDSDEDGSREHFREATGVTFWDDLDEDEREGWNDNINKD